MTKRTSTTPIRRSAATAAHWRQSLQWLERPRSEPLKDGVRVVVAGPPNAGKSSLINAIAGSERAIVSDMPGTTRDHIEVPLALGGCRSLLTDTAGLRETDEAVEAIGVGARRALIEAPTSCCGSAIRPTRPTHPRLILRSSPSPTLPAGSTARRVARRFRR